MSPQRELFASFLAELGLSDPAGLLSRFELYHSLLLELNVRVNLFSRGTAAEDLWSKHFLDSLLPLKSFDFNGKEVLDFGSGGGLPGIPVKLAVPSCRMTLLDSVRKKTVAMQEMIGRLELEGCSTVWSRLEDLPASGQSYDIILCRALRLEERYLKPLRQLLRPAGQVLFYKAQDSSDLDPYRPRELCRMELDYGQRVIYTLDRAALTK